MTHVQPMRDTRAMLPEGASVELHRLTTKSVARCRLAQLRPPSLSARRRRNVKRPSAETIGDPLSSKLVFPLDINSCRRLAPRRSGSTQEPFALSARSKSRLQPRGRPHLPHLLLGWSDAYFSNRISGDFSRTRRTRESALLAWITKSSYVVSI